MGVKTETKNANDLIADSFYYSLERSLFPNLSFCSGPSIIEFQVNKYPDDFPGFIKFNLKEVAVSLTTRITISENTTNSPPAAFRCEFKYEDPNLLDSLRGFLIIVDAMPDIMGDMTTIQNREYIEMVGFNNELKMFGGVVKLVHTFSYDPPRSIAYKARFHEHGQISKILNVIENERHT